MILLSLPAIVDQDERLGSDDCHDASADNVSASSYWINMSKAEYPKIVPVYCGRDPSVWNRFRSIISPEPRRDPSVWLPCGCVYDFDKEESSISLKFLEYHELQSKIYNDLVGLIWFRPPNGQDRQTLFRVVPSETIPDCADIQFGKNWLKEALPSEIGDDDEAIDRKTDGWENVRELFSLLYVTEGMKLWEVMRILENDRGFRRTERQYKRMIAKWGLDTKNIRERDMKFVLAKQQKRKQDEGKYTEFEVNGRPVPARKIQRFLQRKDVSEQELQLSDVVKRPSTLPGKSPSILIHLKATPPHISYYTPFPTAEVGDESDQTDYKLQAYNGDAVPGAARRFEESELFPCNFTVTSAASPFECWSQRYDLAMLPSWIRSYMTPRNPLSIISPAPINVVSTIWESERDVLVVSKASFEFQYHPVATAPWKAKQDGNEELNTLETSDESISYSPSPTS